MSARPLTCFAVLAMLLVGVASSGSQEAPPPAAPPNAVQDHAIQAPQPTQSLSEKPVSEDAIRELVRRAMENDLENYRQQKNLTHVERVETDHLDGDGNLKKTEAITREILILYGKRVERVIERDDKPLTGKQAEKEQEDFEKEVGKLAKESPEDREKRLAKYEKQAEKGRQFVRSVANTYTFQLVGEEMVNGRPAYVIEGTPRPGFQPKTREEKILTKMKGRIWIDMAATQWVKLDVEFTDTVSFGLFLARVRRGTRVEIEQVLFRDQIWVPREIKFKLDARVALLKQFFRNVDITFRDWREFSSETRITDVKELERAPAQPPLPAGSSPH